MADEDQNQDGGEGGENNGTGERKGAGDAWKLLRQRDGQLAEQARKLAAQEERLARLEAERVSSDNEKAAPVDPNAEPDITTHPADWLKWSRKQDQIERQQQAVNNQLTELNSWAMSQEAVARQQLPDYEPAVAYLRTDYAKELEETGELDQAIFEAMQDPNQKQNITNYAIQQGVSEPEAAREMVINASWEWRRRQIVKAQRRKGGNPAVKAYEMAKKRGWNGQAPKQAGGKVVDEALNELERKRNLTRGTQSLSDVRDGGEPRDQRVWTYDDLDALRKSNPAEYRRVTTVIATQADSDPGLLGTIIRH
jgi:hypothetical protein